MLYQFKDKDESFSFELQIIDKLYGNSNRLIYLKYLKLTSIFKYVLNT